MKKILKLLLSLMILSSAFVPSMMMRAEAGVVSKFFEVDEDERKAKDAERVRAQEEYKQEAKAQQNKAAVKKSPAKKKAIAKKPVVKAETSDKSGHFILWRILGSVVGLPVGSVAGLVRGGVSKGAELAGDFSDGDGVVSNVLGKPSGAIVGGVSGALTGILNGAVTGLTKGWDNPFSEESFSLDGDSYDPFEFN